jgi:hypothetical protein
MALKNARKPFPSCVGFVQNFWEGVERGLVVIQKDFVFYDCSLFLLTTIINKFDQHFVTIIENV